MLANLLLPVPMLANLLLPVPMLANLLLPVPMVGNLLLLSKNVLLKETALHECLLQMPSCCHSCTVTK